MSDYNRLNDSLSDMRKMIEEFQKKFNKALSTYYSSGTYHRTKMMLEEVSIMIAEAFSKIDYSNAARRLNEVLAPLMELSSSWFLSSQQKTMEVVTNVVDELPLDAEEKDQILPAKQIESLKEKRPWTREQKMSFFAILLSVLELLLMVIQTLKTENNTTNTYNITINSTSLQDNDTSEDFRNIEEKMNQVAETLQSLYEELDINEQNAITDEKLDDNMSDIQPKEE